MWCKNKTVYVEKRLFIQGKEIGSVFYQKFEVDQHTEKIEVSFGTIFRNHAFTVNNQKFYFYIG